MSANKQTLPPEIWKLFRDAEDAWLTLLNASRAIQHAADQFKKTNTELDSPGVVIKQSSAIGYEIQKALNKHRPDKIEENLFGLRVFMGHFANSDAKASNVTNIAVAAPHVHLGETNGRNL